MAMFQPEMATTWLAPAVVNAAARSRSTRSRSPISTPAASPASGSGMDRSRPSAAARRNPSSVRPSESSAGTQLERVGAQGADRPDPGEVRAVVVGEAAVGLDRAARRGRRARPAGTTAASRRRAPAARRRGAPSLGARPLAAPRRSRRPRSTGHRPSGSGPGAWTAGPPIAAASLRLRASRSRVASSRVAGLSSRRRDPRPPAQHRRGADHGRPRRVPPRRAPGLAPAAPTASHAGRGTLSGP